MPGEVGTPPTFLYRLGRKPDVLEWPRWDRVGDGRFDDPRRDPGYRVLYAGERRACFFEKLAPFRPEREGIAGRAITRSWIEDRRIARFRLHDPDHRWRWLDLGSPATFAEFRIAFAPHLEAFGLRDFDLAAAVSDERALTQPIALWAFRRGYHGIKYPTRHDPSLSCWAIFGVFGAAEIVDVEQRPVSATVDDLRAIADAWGLALPTPRRIRPRPLTDR